MNISIPHAGHFLAKNDFLRSLTRLGSVMGLAIASWSLSFAAHAQAGQTIEGVFTNANSAPAWTISGSIAGRSGVPATDGSGWLRLTPAAALARGQIQTNARIPSQVPLRLEFDYLPWGTGPYGRPAEGLSIYFADASVASAGQGGELGGGLGYCGMTGAFLGVGIDFVGNFTRLNCGSTASGALQGPAKTGTSTAQGNVIGVRGPQSSNYAYLGRSAITPVDACLGCTDRSKVINSARHVTLDMVPRTPAASGYVLTVKVDGLEIIKAMDFPYAPPAQFVMGLIGSTGSWASNHEVRNVKLSVQGSGVVVVTPSHCLNGANAAGKCLPVDNLLKGWDASSFAVGWSGGVPPQWVDGDLAQTGWDGTVPWAQDFPTTQGRGCLTSVYTAKTPQGSRANQIVVVSRQDDWQNAVDPTESMTFTKHGLQTFHVVYKAVGGAQTELGSVDGVIGNNKVIRVFDLPKTEMVDEVGVTACQSPDGGTSPLTEILLWEKK